MSPDQPPHSIGAPPTVRPVGRAWSDRTDSPTEASQGSSRLLPGHGVCILILEDDEALRRLMKLMLEREGFRVLDAIHGQQGLDLIADQGLPDIALVDLMMPVMNGDEFIRAVKAKGWQLPAVFVSASPEAQEVCAQMGLACVKKPYDFAVLLATILGELESAAATGPAR